MKITDEQEERCAIIAEGCKISQHQADLLYAEQIRVSTVSETHWVEKIARIREQARLQKIGRHKIIDGKTLSGGDA